MNMFFEKKCRSGFPVKWVAVLAVLLQFGVCASAENLPQPCLFETYARMAFAGVAWETDGADEIWMTSPEEGVTVSVCLKGEEVAVLTVEYPVGQAPDSARQALEGLGWLSADEFEPVFTMPSESVQEIETFSVCRVKGELREGISICRTEDAGQMVWQPVHGGERIHSKPLCTGMDVPRMITEDAARAVGWKNCGKCRKNK